MFRRRPGWLDHLRSVALEERAFGIHYEDGAPGCVGASGDQVNQLIRPELVEEVFGGSLAVDQDDCLLVELHHQGRLLEIIDDDTPLEAIDDAISEADGHHRRPPGGGCAGQLGGHRGEDPLHPIGGDGDVDGLVAVDIDQDGPLGALTHGRQDQGNW